jgi:hypothetical protein
MTRVSAMVRSLMRRDSHDLGLKVNTMLPPPYRVNRLNPQA